MHHTWSIPLINSLIINIFPYIWLLLENKSYRGIVEFFLRSISMFLQPDFLDYPTHSGILVKRPQHETDIYADAFVVAFRAVDITGK